MLSVPDYLKWVNECMLQEESYCNKLLDIQTHSKLLDLVERVLITEYNQQILDKDSGLSHMIDTKQWDNLKLMYSSFSHNP